MRGRPAGQIRCQQGVPLRKAKTVRFCTDSEAVANHNYVTSLLEEQANRESKVSGVERAKNKHGCLTIVEEKFLVKRPEFKSFLFCGCLYTFTGYLNPYQCDIFS